MTSLELYQLAYKAHYTNQEYDKAEELYNKLIEEYPDSQEAGYAKTQLENIEKIRLIPKSALELIIKKEVAGFNAVKEILISTTPFIAGYEEVKTIDIVTAECVYGMNIFKDIFAGLSDIFGGRSTATQDILKEARINCLYELRKEAYELGANAVVGVDLDYSELSGQGKSMLFLVASGTAVILKRRDLIGDTVASQ